MNRSQKMMFAMFLCGALLAAAWFVVAPMFRSGGLGRSAAEKWAGDQIVAIVNDHIQPEFHFRDLQYTWPDVATFRDVYFEHDGVRFIECDEFIVALGAIPTVGEPISIEMVTINAPTVRLQQRDDGTVIGFDDFIETDAGAARDDGGSTKLSDVLAISRIQINDGAVELTLGDSQPIVIDGLGANMTGASSRPGLYEMQAAMHDVGVMHLDLGATLNLDALTESHGDVTVRMELSPETMVGLPAPIRAVVESYGVQGSLTAQATGTPLTSPRSIDVTASLTDAVASGASWTIPIREASLSAAIGEDQAVIESIDAALLNGSIAASVTVTLDEDLMTEFDAAFDGLSLAEALRETERSYEGEASGTLSGTVFLSAPTETLRGDGSVTIERGRFAELPILGALAEALSIVFQGDGATDRADAELTLLGDHINVREMKIISQTLAVRGEGEVYFDGPINFRVNAGGVEKIQESLGPLGELFGALTDKLGKYHVTGTFEEPDVSVKPLGIGADPEIR